MPTIEETWEQLDQESIRIAWEKEVDQKGFEIAWRIELRRLSEDAKRELGYVYVFLGGAGRTERQRVSEEVARVEARMAHRELPNPRLHHLHKFLDALLCTYQQYGRKGEHDTPEFLWAIFFIGVVDRVDPRRENTYTSSPLVLDARRYLVVLRDQVELEVHKLQHEQSSDVLTKPVPKKAAEESPRSESPKKDKPTGFEGLPELPDSEIDLWLDNAELTGPQRECAELAWKYRRGLSEISSRRKKGKDRKTIYELLCRARVKIDKAVRKLGMTKLAPMTKSPNSGDASDSPMN